jgi:hypothetical protein
VNADDKPKTLRWLAKETEFAFAAEELNGTADLIESLQAQLDAAKRDIQLAAEGEICDICTHSGEDAGDKKTACWDCTQGNPKFEWRGTQEAGKGEKG